MGKPEDPYVVPPDMPDEKSIRLAKQRDDEIENGEVTLYRTWN